MRAAGRTCLCRLRATGFAVNLKKAGFSRFFCAGARKALVKARRRSTAPGELERRPIDNGRMLRKGLPVFRTPLP